MPNRAAVTLSDKNRAALERAKAKLDLTNSALARECGVSQPTISQILSGDRHPSPELLTAISTALGLSWEQPEIRFRKLKR